MLVLLLYLKAIILGRSMGPSSHTSHQLQLQPDLDTTGQADDGSRQKSSVTSSRKQRSCRARLPGLTPPPSRTTVELSSC